MKTKSVTLAGGSNLPFASQLQNNDEVAFDLYLKNRELKQINHSLRKISQWNTGARTRWLTDNQDVLDQLVDSFMDDSALIFDGLKLQGEALNLSVELVSNLREVMAIIRNLLGAGKRELSKRSQINQEEW